LKQNKRILFLKKKNQKDSVNLDLGYRPNFTVMAGLDPAIHALISP
jgi:hypothetical protein